MSRPSVLITGASGLLGRQVVSAFEQRGWAVTGTAFSRADGKTLLRVDLENAPEVEKVLGSVRPDVVVHCAANRFPDKVDSDPAGARRINVEATRMLAQLCADRGATLIYISTDYVFPGRPGEAPYEVDAVPAPTNLYGQTKLEGERAVLDVFGPARQTKGRGVVLRVPLLYGRADKPADSAVNVLLDVVNRVQATGVTVDMDHWAIRYPTNTEDVARVVQGNAAGGVQRTAYSVRREIRVLEGADPFADIARKYIEADSSVELPSILHFSSEDRVTKYEICQRLAEILGANIECMVPVGLRVDAEAGAVQRPYDCHLSTKALKELGIAVHTQDFVAWWRWETRAFRH